MIKVPILIFLLVLHNAVAQQGASSTGSGGSQQPLVREGNPAKSDKPEIAGKNEEAKPVSSEPSVRASDLSFHWRTALLQSLLLLSLQRGVDIVTEPDTRINLRGPFLKDYVRSVANTHAWRDGDSSTTNYLAHPFQGAITGFIEVENDPKGRSKKFEWKRSYWKSRLKAMGWAAAYSTYFEIGPGMSEAMIGNVGLPAQYRAAGSKPRPSNGGMGYVDMVITPTVGTAWLVGEDLLARYVIARIENHTSNRLAKEGARILLNPARSSANLLRGEKPWHRESPGMSLIQ